jgi:hypothetical protein
MDWIVARFLSNFLSDYIDPVESRQVKSAVLNGTYKIQDVTVKSTAFSSLGIPVTIEQSCVQQMSIRVRPTALSSNLTEITSRGIYILGTIDGSVLLTNDLAGDIARFAELKKLSEQHNTSTSSFLVSSGLNALSNLQA